MEKCPNCGNKLTDIDVLCPECGKLVVVIQLDRNHSVKTVNASQDPSAVIQTSAIHNRVVENPQNAADIAAYSPLSPNEFRYSVDEDTYTEDYLDTIRKMPLPELDDLSDFDPDAFLSEYRQKKDQQNKSQVLIPINTDDPSSEPKTNAETTEKEEQSTQEELLVVENADITEDKPAVNSVDSEENVTAEAKRSDQSNTNNHTKKKGMRRKRAIPLPITILLWAASAAVLFFAFFYADNYAKTHYQGVNNMLYEMSDGNLDLSGATSEINISME